MFMYKFDEIQNELDAIDNRMALKKRYVVQHKLVQQAKKEREANKINPSASAGAGIGVLHREKKYSWQV